MLETYRLGRLRPSSYSHCALVDHALHQFARPSHCHKSFVMAQRPHTPERRPQPTCTQPRVTPAKKVRLAEGHGEGQKEDSKWGGGRLDPGSSRSGSSGEQCILSPFLGLIHWQESTKTCQQYLWCRSVRLRGGHS